MTARMLATIASEMQAVAVGWQIYSADPPRAGSGTGRPGAVSAGNPAVSGGGADGRPLSAAAHFAVLLCGVRRDIGAASGIDAARTDVGVAGLRGAAAERRGARFNGPASQAFLPLVVPVEVFPSAVALGSGVFQGAMVVGPMVGGLVYGITGSPAPVYAGSVAACLSAMVLMGRVRVKAVQRPRGVVQPGSAAGRAALSVAREVDAGRDLARHVRGAVGRRGGADAGIRQGHSEGGRDGPGDPARRARDRAR